MNNADLPIFLVAIRDGWVMQPCRQCQSEPEAPLAFGTLKQAEEYVQECAKDSGIQAAMFRIAEYRFSGNVFEGGEQIGAKP